MTRSREEIVLAETADRLADVAWTASHRKDNKRVHNKGLKAMSDAYCTMKIAQRKRDYPGFYAAQKEFDEALEAMHAAETEPWEA